MVVYVRKDTPPGLNTAADLMKAKEVKALSLDTHNTNTVHQALALDVLGVKFKAVTGYKGLKEVETAILQNEGQLANSSLPGWRASIEPTMAKQGIVIPLWQVAPPGKGGTYPRSPVVPEIQTFEEYLRHGEPGQEAVRRSLPGDARRDRRADRDVPHLLHAAEGQQGGRRHHARGDRVAVEGSDLHQGLRQGGALRSGAGVRARTAKRSWQSLANVRPEIRTFLKDYGNNLPKR